MPHGNPYERLETSELLKGYGEKRESHVLQLESNISSVNIFHLKRPVHIFEGHMLDTICQSSSYFFLLPFTQRLMSSKKKPNLVKNIFGAVIQLFHSFGYGSWYRDPC